MSNTKTRVQDATLALATIGGVLAELASKIAELQEELDRRKREREGDELMPRAEAE